MRRIVLLQQTEYGVGAFIDVELRIGALGIEFAAEEIGIGELRLKENQVDAIIPGPPIRAERGRARQQLLDVLAALQYSVHAVVRQAVIEAVISSAAGGDWIRRVPPLI